MGMGAQSDAQELELIDELAMTTTSGTATDTATQETLDEDETFGLLSLVKTVLDRKTMPHLLLLVMATSALYVFTMTDSSDVNVIAAMCFIALSLSYCATAYLSGNEAIGRILRTTQYETDADEDGPKAVGKLLHLLKQVLKAWALPLCIAGALMLLMVFLLGDEGPLSGVGSALPLILASLFVLWSIGQGMSFRTSTTTYISGRLDSKSEADKRGSFALTAATMVTINLVFGGALVFIFVSIQDAELNTADVESTMLKHILYLIALLVSQGLILWWSKPLLKVAVKHKRAAAFSLRWGIIVQGFAAWHLMSIYRQYSITSPQVFTIFEELFLMVFTVLLAIWGTTTKGMAKGSSIFTKDNALFWGLAFGFGYAGSITMVANVLGDVKEVLMAGHAITWLTLLLLHRFALRDFIYSENLMPADGSDRNSGGAASAGSANDAEDAESSATDIDDQTETMEDGRAGSGDAGATDESTTAGGGDLAEDDGSAIGDDTEVDWSANIPSPIESDDDWQLDDDDTDEEVDDGLGDVEDEDGDDIDDGLELLD